MRPVALTWHAAEGIFRPLARFAGVCAKQFDDNRAYPFVVEEQRSKESHDHYFACINDAWSSLPYHLQDEFPSPTHLRKFGLCKAGYCDIQKIIIGDDTINLKPVNKDQYSIIEITGNVITIRTAHSQSKKAMGHKVFQESKDKVLTAISQLIGVDVTTLQKNAGRAA